MLAQLGARGAHAGKDMRDPVPFEVQGRVLYGGVADDLTREDRISRRRCTPA